MFEVSFRRLRAVAAALAGGTAVVATLGASLASAADEVVVYHYQSGSNAEALRDMLDRFEAETGITVKDFYKSSSTVPQDVQAALAAGRTVDLAQIIVRTARSFVSQVPLTPFDEDAPEYAFLQNYSPEALDIVRVDGKIYGGPHSLGTPLLYYNKDIFRNAGLDPENPPKTFDEVVAAAEVIREKAGVEPFGMIIGTGRDYGMQTMVLNGGGQVLSDDGTTILIDSEKSVRALQLMQDLVVKHRIMTPVTEDRAYGSAFIAGALAMHFNTSASLRSVIRSTDGVFDLGVASAPTMFGEPRRVPNSGSMFMVFPTEGEARARALKLAEFLSRPEHTNEWNRRTGYMPLAADPLADEAYADFIANDRYAKAVLNQMNDTVGTVQWPGATAFEVQASISMLVDDLWANKGSAAELVPPVAEDINRILETDRNGRP